MPSGEQSSYQSYLLRLWRDGWQGPWRVSLQSIATGDLHRFADLRGMWAFLQTQLGRRANDPVSGDALPNHADSGGPR